MMFSAADILTYAFFTVFGFAALCAMTRVGRGWVLQLLGLLVLATTDFVVQWVWLTVKMPLDFGLSFCFAIKWLTMATLTLCLSRDSIGRRFFLAIVYGAYGVCFAVVFHLLTYRNVCGLDLVWFAVAGFSSVAAMNLAFLFWVLPRMPRDDRNFCWLVPCINAGLMFVSLFVSGVWPISVVSAPARYCSVFALISAAAWVVFPLICQSIRDRQHAAEVERNLEMLMTEMKVRRAAIDQARRIRHDQRHHRAQIAEYMLCGKYDKVLAYLNELDEEAQDTPTDKLVWCENETMNAILSVATRSAAARGVEFKAEVHVEGAIALSDVETVAVAANLIENAINACDGQRPCEGMARPVVQVMIRQREFGLGITVENPVSDGFALSSNGFPCSEPGIGMESIRRVVVRHNGKWTYELNENHLKCQVILMLG